MATMDLATLGLEVRSDGVVVASQRLRDLANQSRNAENAANRASQSTSGLSSATFGLERALKKAAFAMGTLVAGYASLKTATSFMQKGLQFNSSLEQSKIGLATLITSMVKLGDAQGKVLTGMEKYQAAQGIAANIMTEIQNLAATTSATMESLTEGVQTIMGPALQAGFALKDIPKFAARGAQAMQTLGIPLMQMRTELEALLSGNVNKAQDLLAPKLFADVKGDLGTYIRGLRDSGKLVDELTRRLEPFDLASKDLAQTWSVLSKNFSDAWTRIAGTAGQGFTKSMKESVGIMSKLITGGSATGVSKEFQGILEVLSKIENKIGSGIVGATNSFANAIRAVGDYINKVGSDRFLLDMTETTQNVTVALIALIAARKAATAQFVLGNGENQRTITGLGTYLKTLVLTQRELQNVTNAQRQEMLAAQQAVATFQRTVAARMEIIAAIRGEAAAHAYREAMLIRETALVNAATAAEERYVVAQKASSIWARAGAVAKNAANAALALVGGLPGLVVTGLTFGLMELLNRTDDAALATQKAHVAEQSFAEAMKLSTDNAKNLTEELKQQLRIKAEIAERDNQASREADLNAIRSSLNKRNNDYMTINGVSLDFLSKFTGKTTAPKKYVEELFAGLDKASKGGSGAIREFNSQVMNMIDWLMQGEHANSQLLDTLLDLAREKGPLQHLMQLADELDRVQNAANGATQGVRELDSAAGAMGGAIATALTKASLEKYTSGLGKEQQAVAKGLVTDLKFTEQQTKDFFAGRSVEGVTAEQLGKVKTLAGLYKDIYKAHEAASSKAQSAANKLTTATEGIRRIKDEIDQLNGVSEKATAQMAKKQFEIGQVGKEAKLSAGEIEKLKGEYIAAFRTNATKEFDKEIVRLSGNASELRRIELEETIAKWRDKFEAAGYKLDEINPKMKQLRESMEKQAKIEDAQVALQFFKELSDMGTKYGEELQLQNKLLEAQAETYRTKLPADMQVFVDKWLELKRLQESQDPKAGIMRGLATYVNEASNLAKGMEGVVTNAFSNMEDSMLKFVQTGKLSFKDLADSIISDLMRIFIRAAITGPLAQGIMGAMGGLFSGGTYNGLTKQAAVGAANTSGYAGMSVRYSGASAKGNVFSGGNLSSYSGAIVSSPTFFGYDQKISTFARGSGLMGEAGPEAILPLQRASNGKLGVAMTGNGNAPAQIKQDISINVYNETDAKVTTKQNTDDNGNVSIDVMIGEMVGRQIATAGSAPNRAIRGSFGARQVLANR